MEIWPTPKPALKAAIAILEDAFGTTLVSASMPRRRPAKFLQVTRVGGGQPNPAADVARILVECFGPDPATVESMTGTARSALRNAAGTTVAGVFVRGWTAEQGPTDFPHPEILDLTRWQFTGDLLLATR